MFKKYIFRRQVASVVEAVFGDASMLSLVCPGERGRCEEPDEHSFIKVEARRHNYHIALVSASLAVALPNKGPNPRRRALLSMSLD